MTAYNFVGLVPDTSYNPRYEPGYLYSIEFQFTQTVAFVNGDTVTTPANALPGNGIRIQEVEVIHPSLDTNGSPTCTYSVGDSGSASRFISTANGFTGSTGGQVKNLINVAQALTAGVVSSGTNYLYGSANASAPQLILTINGVVATGSTTATVRLKVWFWSTGEAA